MGVGDILSEFVEAYREFHMTFPPLVQDFILLFMLVLLIVIYAVFVWKLHTFIGTKNIFRFKLSKYNKSSHPALAKIAASGFYLLEYLLIIPFIIFFWFVVFTFFLILLVEESITIPTILLISAIAVASIRMSAYIPNYGENVARELAKILPFTFLGVAVLNPGIFTDLFARVIMRLENISLFFVGAMNYLLFIAILELILRFFEFLFNIIGIHDEEEEEDEEADEKN